MEMTLKLGPESHLSNSSQKILMVPPQYFGVNYVINAWMEGQEGRADNALATQQWQNLHAKLTKHVTVHLATPEPGLPDYVFTANAGLVFNNNVVISRFRNKQRQGEETPYRNWFVEHGFGLLDWPDDVSFEGAGDALFDRGQDIIWCGYGFRSDPRASGLVAQLTGRKAILMRLTDPRFYHIDTCLCPLAGGYVMYYPAAFDSESVARLHAALPPEKRLEVSEDDALGFACNAVDIGQHVFMNKASDKLQAALRQIGFTAVVTPVTEFLKAGGGVKCLVLKLVEP